MPTEPQDPMLWIVKAEPEQQGSFCDVDSQNHYLNVSDFGKAAAADSAGRVMEVADVDAPRPDETNPIDTRHNLYYTENDGQGLDTPMKYGPGR